MFKWIERFFFRERYDGAGEVDGMGGADNNEDDAEGEIVDIGPLGTTDRHHRREEVMRGLEQEAKAEMSSEERMRGPLSDVDLAAKAAAKTALETAKAYPAPLPPAFEEDTSEELLDVPEVDVNEPEETEDVEEAANDKIA